ncbi:MAG TPA: TonB-dependent receptor, partial [Burkholderiaceae bacterium]|nr:TonB-dependent receptor [Burkholderiaceae bacterium]
GPGAQVDTSPSPAYYGYALNPFENYLLSGKAMIGLTDRLRLDVSPYFWYGYGTGGLQQTTLAESNSSTVVHGGIADINGDGDRSDTVLVYRGSLTQTFRPGINAALTYVLDNHKINGGVWFERARHRQTQPAVTVGNDGGVTDIWLGGNLLRYNDGSTYNGRNQNTVSTGESVFVQDTIDLLSGKLQVTPAFSYRRIKREFSNYANSGTAGSGAAFGSSGVDYSVERTYGAPLPSLAVSLQASDRLQVFSSLAKNFKAPGNFEYQSLATGVTYANGVGTSTGMLPLTVKEETSVNLDLGARYKGDWYRASATAFYNKFKDRIASSYDPATTLTHDFNVGDSTTKGLEIEAGTVPIAGFSGYASLTYTKSTLDENMLSTDLTKPYLTAGKQFPDTPKGMAALSLQYANGPYLLNVSGKYTTSRTLTLTNDVVIPGFTTVDFNAAWKLPNPSGNGFKNPIIRLNVSNIFNRQYFMANAGSGSNVQIANANIVTGAATTPFYYAGAPRFASMTFQVDY